jgi:radical SAM/Cys-rich protein
MTAAELDQTGVAGSSASLPQRERPGLLPMIDAIDFASRVAEAGEPPLVRGQVTTLQVNVGKRCNLACHHCHVDAGPKRTEAIDRRGAERILELLAAGPEVEVLDLTGGAPELNENFRFLVAGARGLGRRVIDRCNLTVLELPGQEETADFLAEHEVEVVASLPCYTKENVEGQRGRGVFQPSIDALHRLNRLGYGREGSPRKLRLVYNPLGAFLPPPQKDLEARYRSELRERFGIEFHDLLTLTNMPIKRFAGELTRQGRLSEYLSLLVNLFNSETLPGLMCRALLSVGYGGRLYDCDFNQNLEIEMPGPERTIWDLDDLSALEGRAIATGSHCFGCTAGAGSSCGGSLI